MSRYTVELDGKRITLEGDRPPTEQEVRSLLGQQRPTAISPVERTESRIAGRTSLLPQVGRDLTAAPRSLLGLTAPPPAGQNRLQQLSGALKEISRAQLQGPFHRLGAAQELVEGVTASPIVSAQARRPIGRDLLSVLTGKRVVERGDIARNVGAPEPVAAMFGMVTGPETLIPAVAGTRAAIGGVGAGGRAVGEFLRGSPQRIDQAEKAAHRLVQSVRSGGKQVRGFFNRLGDQSETAWAPMKQVTAAINDPIEVDTLRQLAAARFSEAPNRLQGVLAVFDDVFREGTSFTASNLADFGSDAGRKLPAAVLRGAKARTQLQQFTADARSIIAEAIEQAAPQEWKGAVGQAKGQWANYAADRDRLFDLFQPGSSPQRETKAGINFLRRAAEGRLNQSEQEFLGRLTQQFPELSEEIARIQKQLGGAIRRGERGRATTQFAKRYGPGASLVGAGAALASLFGQRQP